MQTFLHAVYTGGALRNLAILLGCIFFSLSAYADPTVNRGATGKRVSSGSGASTDIKASNNQVGIQTISTSVNYTETGNGLSGNPSGTLDTETGAVPGRGIYYSVMNNILFGNDYFRATYDQSIGMTNYVGGTLNPPSAYGTVVSTSSATLTNYSFRYGKGFDLRGTSMLTPYIEFGSHKWDRGVNYGETYSNMYFGYGLLNQYSLGNRLVLSIDAMVGHTTQSAIVVTSSPAGTPPASQLIGFSGPLGNSDLYKFGISLDYALVQTLHLNLGADYSAFSYGISGLYPSGANLVFEPDSKTNYITIRFGLGLGF